MAAVPFDTLKYVERLEKAGIPREQAKAEAEALAEVLSSGVQDLVTNERLESRLSAQTAEIIKWVAGLLIAQAALVAALVKLI
ncbi:MAG: hypothetical protein RLZ92_401 [Pseudomonadota bacterium]|jgi:hypothetical protein